MAFTKRSLLAAAMLASQATAALQPIITKGSKFFYENGTQFYIKGIAYQQEVGAAGAVASNTTTTTYRDPLADTTACTRDVPNLQKAGTNAIRVYAIDPTADHTECMSLLDAAGIYVIADLGEPATSINRDTPQWNVKLFDRYKAVVDEMGKYTNTIGFFSGNEVTNQKNNTMASAYVKAATRDTKKYIKSKGGRWMGVGYATNDDTDIRDPLAAYFNCGDPDAAIDYWGYNIYSWCGNSDFTKSSYDTHIKNFATYSVPVFLAEYGCVDGLPEKSDSREWTEATALYSDRMTGTFSGGIVYMYFEEANNYGLFKDGKTMKNFDALAKVINSVTPKTIQESDYTGTNTPLACPGIQENWLAASNLPPTPDKTVCDCMAKTATCAPARNLAEKDFGAVFNFICGAKPDLCKAINGNATTGQYGLYHGCDDRTKLTNILDAYFKSLSSSASACSFDGKATVVTPSAMDATCSQAIASASTEADKANSATDSAASTNSAAGFGDVRVLAMGAYFAAAAAAGATMLML